MALKKQLKTEMPSDSGLPPYFEKYMEEKFKTLHDRLDIADDWREAIDLSIKETNHILSTQIEQSQSHYVICPNTSLLSRVNVLEMHEKVEELAFIRKNYKVFGIAGVVTLLLFFAGLFGTYVTITDYIGKQHYLTIEAIKQDEQLIEHPKPIDKK